LRLEAHERKALLGLARQAIAARLEGCSMDAPVVAGGLALRAGAFVTIRYENRLRGCLGLINSEEPLAEVVVRCAGDAATLDPRFPPLPLRELRNVSLEISVLGPVEPVKDSAEVEVGRHGLVVEQGRRRSLLLPQVPIEFGWSLETFLSQGCVKAGLSADAWQRGAKIFTFEADVFSE